MRMRCANRNCGLWNRVYDPAGSGDEPANPIPKRRISDGNRFGSRVGAAQMITDMQISQTNSSSSEQEAHPVSQIDRYCRSMAQRNRDVVVPKYE